MMGLSKFFKTSALLGLVGGMLLDTAVHAMARDTSGDERDTVALAGRVAAVNLSEGSVEEEVTSSTSLPPKVLADFLARFKGVKHEYPVKLQNGHSGKIRFRFLLDNVTDLQALKAALGPANESQCPRILQDNVDGIKKFMAFDRPRQFKWLFSYSDEGERFIPAGFVGLEVPNVVPVAALVMALPPAQPGKIVAAPKGGIYEKNVDVLGPIIETFFKEATSRCGVIYGVKARSELDPQLIFVLEGGSPTFFLVGERFGLRAYEDRDVSYTAQLFTHPLNAAIKAEHIAFQRELLTQTRQAEGLPATVTVADDAELERQYGEMARQQALAFRAYERHVRSRQPLDLEGLTWVIRRGETIIGLLTGKAGLTGTRTQHDMREDPSFMDRLTKYFTGQIGSKIGM